jgi:hypothetical protein
MSSFARLVLSTLVSIAAIGFVAADHGPDFGPETFVLTDDGVRTFQQSFSVEQEGTYLLILGNGDDEGNRTESAIVEVNGASVIGAGEVTIDTGGVARPLELAAGTNELVVSLEGAAGSFAVVALGRPDRPPVFATGRLLLPWGRNDQERVLSLALKNGSPRFPRRVRAVFYGPGGSVTGVSEWVTMPPRGSLASTVDALLAEGEFVAGSVEIFWAGPGTARVFGTARQIDLPPGVSSDIESLQPAGLRVFRGSDVPEGSPFRRRSM